MSMIYVFVKYNEIWNIKNKVAGKIEYKKEMKQKQFYY